MNESPFSGRESELNHYLLRFWAKTTDDKDDPKRQNAFHPLICHLIDVGVTAERLWSQVLPEITKKRLARQFGLEEDLARAGRLIAFLAGLHDLGKCSPPFALRGKNDGPATQTRRLIELYENTECDCDDFKRASEVPHGFVTSVELPAILIDKLKFPKTFAANIAEIIGGHHGVFAASGKLNDIKRFGAKSVGDRTWSESRFEFAETLERLFKIEGDFSGLPDVKLDNATAMIFAGLTSVADWIGSNTDFFPCEVGDSTIEFSLDPDEYLEKATANAEIALRTLGWTNWITKSKAVSFDELFPELKETHRDLQNVAIKIGDELDSTGIAIIESPMGEGKTEAAMFLADAFNARLGTRGIYFALPTQATSNQMFGRVEKFLQKRFGKENVDVHLMLQHGHASISDEFAEKITNFRNIQNTFDDGEIGDNRKFSNIVAAEWFTYKKRGLLVPFGVGTIDQILLAALQTKHVFVRLFGLAHKTIIIDEVHAYDAYMSTLLERLLEWLAALGSPVIILSATLPRKKRDALIKAYLKGLGKASESDKLEEVGMDRTYPRISYATASMPEKTFYVRHLETSAQNTKTLHLEWKDENNFVEELKLKLKDGGCAAIICNTVAKAQDIFSQLSDDEFFQGQASDGEPTLDLLHARFRYKDRKDREDRSLKRFGKPNDALSEPGAVATGFRKRVVRTSDAKDETGKVVRPDRAVLVSTQIIEQSLDLDFDLMISELAPADLLLQRSGRLQRHKRKRLPQFERLPTLWLIKPETDENGDLLVEKNLPDFGVSGVIYDKHILLRSWLKLRKTTEIKIPDDIERLIEDVYDKTRECFDEKYLHLWAETKVLSNNRLAEKRLKAKAIYLTDFDDDDFYDSFKFQLDEDDPEKHSTLRAQTRDEERPTVSVILLTHDEATSMDLNVIPNRETVEFLIKREVKISRQGLTQAILANPEFKKTAWAKNALLRHHRLLVLNENKEIAVGKTTIFLDKNKGVEYKSEGGKSE